MIRKTCFYQNAQVKELYPDARILPLDYDPDVSTVNIESRLQMLIMNEMVALQN